MAAQDEPDLNYLTFHLDVLSHLMKQQGTAIYQAHADVSLRDLRVLRFVALEPGISPGRVVELSHLEKTAVSKLVTSLVQRGHLRREIGADNARYVNLYLTDVGQRTVAHCDELGKQMESTAMAVLTPRERDVLNRCLRKLTTWIKAQPRALDPGEYE